MKHKEKLAREWCIEEGSKNKIVHWPPGYCDPSAYLAGFEKARELAAKLHSEEGYGECLEWFDFINLGEEEV